jgi:hypothetical protein
VQTAGDPEEEHRNTIQNQDSSNLLAVPEDEEEHGKGGKGHKLGGTGGVTAAHLTQNREWLMSGT